MKIKYRLTFRSEKVSDLANYLLAHNLANEEKMSNEIITSVTVKEGQKHWAFLSAFVNHKNVGVRSSLEFTKKEFAEADWYRLSAPYRFGYPQPEDDWLERRFTYRDYDNITGIYSQQVSSFRIVKNPKTKKDFFSLHWVNELFCKKSVVESLKKEMIAGFDVWPVLINKSNQDSKEICQLTVTKTTQAKGLHKAHKSYLAKPGLYKYIRRGDQPIKFSSELLDETTDVVLSQEFFGANRVAIPYILISKKFYNVVNKYKWKGLKIEPVFID